MEIQLSSAGGQSSILHRFNFLDRIEDGKHFVPEDHPEEVAETVNTLLDQIRGS